MVKNMNVVLYLRYSSDKQTEQSIEGQQRVCSQYCASHDMTIVDVYVDRATSASKNVEKRLAFQKMIRDSEKKGFEAVIVYKLDRFARSRYDSATYKYKLKKNGVRVISATENISDSPEGVILESVLEGMAEFYSLELSQKVTRGMTESALKGNSCGGNIPLGYKIENKKFVIDPLTAPLVEEIFKRYANGETMREIAEDFKARGLKTAKGGDFNKNSFQRLLTNERYLGVYTYKDVRIEDGMPAIIDPELFNVVQRRIAAHKQEPRARSKKENYPLSGKLFCGHCGATMNGEYGTGKSGNRYYYYVCASKKNKRSCDKKNVSRDLIEKLVVEDAVSLLTIENIIAIAKAAMTKIDEENSKNTEVVFYKNRIQETDKAITNLIKLAEMGSDSKTLFDRLGELEREKTTLEKRYREAKATLINLDEDQIVFFLMHFIEGDINDEGYRRRIIDLLINSVTVWDEPDGGIKVTTIYNLSSLKPKTVRCSSEGTQGPPTKKHLQ